MMLWDRNSSYVSPQLLVPDSNSGFNLPKLDGMAELEIRDG